jgi:hypothetical protein
MRKIFFLVALFLCSKFLFAQQEHTQSDGHNHEHADESYHPKYLFQLQEGDLIFQDLDCGPLCDAIEKVTNGIYGIDFSHIGLVHYHENGAIYIIEAIGNNVQETALDLFLTRNIDTLGKPRCAVGRPEDTLQKYIPATVSLCLAEVGKPYDDVFLVNNDKWYCSELLATMFNKASHREIFTFEPMTFKDPFTHEYFPAWIDYYKKLGVNIPEAESGCNPGLMSRSPYLMILLPYARFK